MSWFSELEANLKASANGGNTYFGGGAELTYADFAVLNAIRTVQFMMETQAADALKSCPLLSAWMARIVVAQESQATSPLANLCFTRPRRLSWVAY